MSFNQNIMSKIEKLYERYKAQLLYFQQSEY